jgi:hypothetical protein
MTDKDKKRHHNIAGDNERVAAGAVYRRGNTQGEQSGTVSGEIDPREEDSLAIIVNEDDTPVEIPGPSGRRRARKTVQQFADDIKLDIRALRAEIVALRNSHHNATIDLVTKHATIEANMGSVLRLGAEVDDLDNLRVDLAALRVELVGVNGTNGKVGTLRSDVERSVTELRKDVWGDEIRKEGDAPVIMEARRGKWILRTLLGLALGVAGTVGYIVKDAIHTDGQNEAQAQDDRAELLRLEQRVELLYSRLSLGGSKP